MNKNKKIIGFIITVFFVFYVSSAGALVAVDGKAIDIPLRPVDSLIVKFVASDLSKHGQNNIDKIKQKIFDISGTRFENSRIIASDTHVFKINQQDGARLKTQGAHYFESILDNLVDQLNEDPAVEYAEKNANVYVTADDVQANEEGVRIEPNDSRYSEQWHYHDTEFNSGGINLPLVWGHHTIGTDSTIIAVLDSGLSRNTNGKYHVALEGKILPGYNSIQGERRDDVTEYDPIGGYIYHGTHVAATIAANTNQSLVVSGVNWLARILPVRVLGSSTGTIASLTDGIYWAIDEHVDLKNEFPAQVINLSIGSSIPSPCPITLQRAINAAVEKGVVVVVAAGNESRDGAQIWPANCKGVVAVAATGPNAQIEDYSNYGEVVTVAAPGGGLNSKAEAILSANDAHSYTPYAYLQIHGTSMATPHISGIVGLMLAVNHQLQPHEVGQILRDSYAVKLRHPLCNKKCGPDIGLIDAHKAIHAAEALKN